MQIIESDLLFGRNRRSEKTVIEVWIHLTDEECTLVEENASDFQSAVLKGLSDLGVSHSAKPLEPEGTGAQQYAAIFCHASLAFQQHTGHQVHFLETYAGASDNESIFAVEYEHDEAGLDAVQLANLLLEEAISEIQLDQDKDPELKSLAEQFEIYAENAPAQLLPRQTQDIIDAAERMDIPWHKLDREPYQGLSGDFRVRLNSMLKLGYACNNRVIDGSFPIHSGEAIAQVLHDRAAVRPGLESLGAPLPAAELCSDEQQAIASAARISYPVIVKPRRISRSHQFGEVSGPLEGPDQLSKAAQAGLNACGSIVIEAVVPGLPYKALLGNGALLGVFELENKTAGSEVTERVHESTRAWLTEISRKLGVPLLTVTIVSENIGLPLAQHGRVVNMDVAPDLDEFLPSDTNPSFDPIRQQAAENLLRNLFPEGQPARVPVVSVTGTNGKSTVCGMISRIMQHQGFTVGRAGTTGIYHNEERLDFGDFSGGNGHYRVLESPDVNLAVLETARGATCSMGLSFDYSDVSVCTNVAVDHLGSYGLDTVEQMAELKRFIVSRSRNTVVLNADNSHSAGMLPFLDGRQAWMVSDNLSPDELRERFGDQVRYCTTGVIDDQEWISLHDHTASVKVIPVNDIPATLEGNARFNVSNAMQAVAASFALGASMENIRNALSTYRPDYQSHPGRLNIYEELPFKVIFDFAHNDEGHRALRQVVDKEQPQGRKVLCFSRRDDTSDEEIFEMASIIADGYDFFICFQNPYDYGREHFEVPPILKKGLVNRGVDEDRILLADTHEAMMMALDECQAGDLLVFCTTTMHLERDWSELTSYHSKPRNS